MSFNSLKTQWNNFIDYLDNYLEKKMNISLIVSF